MTYTFIELAKDTLEHAGIPLSHVELWQKACELGLDKKLSSVGKTSWESISARLYVDMRDNTNSIFCKVGKRPVRFALKFFSQKVINTSEEEFEKNTAKEKNAEFNERDLHPLLSYFVAYHEHFKCYTKTIYHEISTREVKGKNKWLHPDIVGVYFPFSNPIDKNGDYAKSTIKIIKGTSESAIKLFSFEMKKYVSFGNLRECYFQAVSNSSWANEGYLVALKYDKGDEMLDEMRRLTNAFGIGFIELDAENVEQSSILVGAQTKSSIDWDTVNRLVENNDDFKTFVDYINDDNQVEKVRSNYDERMSSSQMENYIGKKGIK